MVNKKRGKKKNAANDDKTKRDATSAPLDDRTALIPAPVLSRILDYTPQATVLNVAAVCRSWRAVAQAHRSRTTLVPASVLSRILDYTSQATVLNVAAVCRNWRPVAQAHYLYYAWVVLDGDGSEYCEKSIEFFKSLHCAVHDAQFKRLHVIVCSPSTDDGIDEKALKWGNTMALRIIRSRMPYIVQLHLSLPDVCTGSLEEFLLDADAPVLEELYCSFAGKGGPRPFAALPPDLFRGSAPVLKSVTLTGVKLTAKPVRAFANVRRVSLQRYSSKALGFVPNNFPGMTHLTLDFLNADFGDRYNRLDKSGPPVESLGARLQHFELNLYASELGLPTQLRTIPKERAIPYIAVLFCADDKKDDSGIAKPCDFAPFLDHVGKPYRVVLRRERQYSGPTAEDWERRPHDASAWLVLEIFSISSHFKRKFIANNVLGPSPASEAALLRRLPELAPHIRELEVADILLRELFHILYELDSRSLPRLKRLTIDFDSPYGDGTSAWEDLARRGSGDIECPILESVTLRCAMAYRPSVYDKDVLNVLANLSRWSELPELCCAGVTLSASDESWMLPTFVKMPIS